MADCIRTKDILAFLNSESGKRMTQAAGNGKLRKEQPFVLGVAASEIYPEIYQDIQKRSQEADENRKEETILIQGIIDVWFEEEDGLVLLDYKTDRVRNASQLKELYHAQLDYYAQALEQLLEKPVKEKIIYSFCLEGGDHLMKYFWYYLIFINLFAFCTYGIDKWKAKKGAWRVPEKTLLILALDRWKCRSNRRYDVLPA